MGVDVYLQGERGNILDEVPDPRSLLIPMIDRRGLKETDQTLRFINPYGNTVFNTLQMDKFLSELEQLREFAETQEEKTFLQGVERLALKCKRHDHYYLKFVGD